MALMRHYTKDATEMLFIGEDLILHRQEDASAVHQVNDRQMIFHGDLLHTQVFLTRNGEPAPAFTV